MVKKNTAHCCENRKNHGKITAVYIAANLQKLMVSNSRKFIYSLGQIDTTMTPRSHSATKHTDYGWPSRGKGKINIFVLNSHNKLQILLIKNKKYSL